MSDFLLYLTNGLVMGIIYALFALGVALIVGIMNVVNFAHGELYVLAGYFSALFATALGMHPALAMIMATLCVFVVGLIVERTLIRPTYGNEMYSLIVTFILSIVLQNAYLLIFGPYPRKPPNLVTGATNVFSLFMYGNQRLLGFVLALVVIVCFFVLIRYTWFGRVVRSVSIDRDMASLMGVNPERVNLLAFGLGCALAGAAGVILTPIFPVTPTIGVGVSLTAFVVVVLGGMGSFAGCVVGGIMLGVMENLGAAYISSAYKQLFGFIILISVLFLRPAGLFGRKRA
ncbi:MAG: branched-chain amino acid ABC transporter permease [Thermodesulfobacteriota bacterium]